MVNGISMTSLPNSLRQITAYLCDRQEAAAVPRKITTANNKIRVKLSHLHQQDTCFFSIVAAVNFKSAIMCPSLLAPGISLTSLPGGVSRQSRRAGKRIIVKAGNAEHS